MDLIPLQTYITPAQDRAVKRLAQQQGTTEAEIIRKHWTCYLPGRVLENMKILLTN